LHIQQSGLIWIDQGYISEKSCPLPRERFFLVEQFLRQRQLLMTIKFLRNISPSGQINFMIVVRVDLGAQHLHAKHFQSTKRLRRKCWTEKVMTKIEVFTKEIGKIHLLTMSHFDSKQIKG